MLRNIKGNNVDFSQRKSDRNAGYKELPKSIKLEQWQVYKTGVEEQSMLHFKVKYRT